MDTSPALIEVFAGTPIEAAVVRSALDAAGIFVVLENEEMGTLAPFQVTAGGVDAVKVLVPEHEVERAREIIEQR